MTSADRGFTLLEVLLAITVFGAVMAMLSLSLSATMRVMDATGQQEEVYLQAQTTLRRLTADLSAAVGDAAVPFSGKTLDLDGQRADTLAFASLAHLVLNPEKQQPGLALIRYQLKPDEEDPRRLKLLRSDTLVLPGVEYGKDKEEAEERWFLLAADLRSVRFVYFDREGQEFDKWDQEAGEASGEGGEEDTPPLPAVVHCTLEFWLDPDKETVQTFTTGIVLPVGLYAAEAKDAN
jgi:general secretion pathway protein J